MVITNEDSYIEFEFSSSNKFRIPKNSCSYRHQEEDYIRIVTTVGEIYINVPTYVSSIVDNVNVSTVNNPATLQVIATALEVDNFLFE
ncbi:MAG: hypothetical protein ACW98X_23385 [Promethearchaeota archaeon]|jgi:hypothetical protein